MTLKSDLEEEKISHTYQLDLENTATLTRVNKIGENNGEKHSMGMQNKFTSNTNKSTIGESKIYIVKSFHVDTPDHNHPISFKYTNS